MADKISEPQEASGYGRLWLDDLDIDPVPSYILLHRSVKAFPVKSSSHLPIGLTSADLHAEKDAQIVRSPLGNPSIAICRSSVQYPNYL